MRIIIDDKIPYIKGVLEPYFDVLYLPGQLIGPEIVRDADALVTRTRTVCSREVLEGSKVKLIATATIGFDHIDTAYCEESGIKWLNAPGCNAESVNQYISSALFSYAIRKKIHLNDMTIGVVGVGQVGSRVAKTAEVLGMNVLLNDPPRERAEGKGGFVSLQTIQEQSDIISFHVPLNRGGIDNTLHMVNQDFLSCLSGRPLLINTCRGEVFDTGAVLTSRQANEVSGLVIDCWEQEPGIDLRLLNLVDFGTPHIAGYSRDGKANGTTRSVRAISEYFGLGIDHWEPRGVETPDNPLIELDGSHRDETSLLAEAVLATYRIENDDRALRDNTHLFEQLRGDYPARREFDSYSIRPVGVLPETIARLEKLGFNIVQVDR